MKKEKRYIYIKKDDVEFFLEFMKVRNIVINRWVTLWPGENRVYELHLADDICLLLRLTFGVDAVTSMT